jgi:leader peptidase (prepilin peptidase) / N-methyltransferase
MAVDPSAPALSEPREASRPSAVASVRRPLPWVAALTAVAAALGWGPHDLAAGAVIGTVVVATLLAFVDLATHRLPNRVVLPLWVGVLSWLAVTAVIQNAWRPLLGAVIGSVALGGVYLVLALIRAGAMGGGDVKLATALGLTAGWYGLHAWSWVCFVPFFAGGLAALVGLASRRLSWTAHLPFGPALALGYCIAVVVAF